MEPHKPPNIPSNLFKPNSIGTQTENSSKICQELKTLNTKICKNPFDNITIKNSPIYLLDLHKTLGEAFISKANKNDSTCNKKETY